MGRVSVRMVGVEAGLGEARDRREALVVALLVVAGLLEMGRGRVVVDERGVGGEARGRGRGGERCGPRLEDEGIDCRGGEAGEGGGKGEERKGCGFVSVHDVH